MHKCIVLLPSKKEDKFAWSGTNYYIYRSLLRFYDVEYIFGRENLFLRFIDKIRMKFLNIFTKKSFMQHTTFYYFISYRKTIKKINKSNNILVFTTMSNIIPFLKNKKVIYIADAIYESMINYYWFNLSKRDINRANKMQKLALDKSYLIAVASDWVKNFIFKFNNLSDLKTVVIPFGSNIKKSSIPNHHIDKTINLLFCGIDIERKGLNFVISVLNQLNSFSKYKFLLNVIGVSGENSDTIKYHGFLNKNDINDLNKINEIYNESDLFLLPTKAECAGIVFCEAMSYGIPLFSCDTGGVSTYVKNGINGYLFSSQEDFVKLAPQKIIDLISNKSKYKNMKNKCLELYKRIYNWESWATKINYFANRYSPSSTPSK